MQVDYKLLKHVVAATVDEISRGAEDPVRRPRAELRVVRDLEGEVTAGPFRFRRAAVIREELDVAGQAAIVRFWQPGSDRAVTASPQAG